MPSLQALEASLRQRYQVLPTSIAERDLRQHFHLSDADRAFVATFREATSRLGVALHLGLLRYLGYLPKAWVVNVPPELRTFVAGQLPDGALVSLHGLWKSRGHAHDSPTSSPQAPGLEQTDPAGTGLAGTLAAGTRPRAR